MENKIYISTYRKKLGENDALAYSYGIKTNYSESTHLIYTPVTIIKIKHQASNGYKESLVDALSWLNDKNCQHDFNLVMSSFDFHQLPKKDLKKLLKGFSNVHFIKVSDEQNPTLAKIDKRTKKHLNSYMSKQKKYEKLPETKNDSKNNDVNIAYNTGNTKQVLKLILGQMHNMLGQMQHNGGRMDYQGKQINYQTAAMQSLEIVLSKTMHIHLPKSAKTIVAQNRKNKMNLKDTSAKLKVIEEITSLPKHQKWITFRDVNRWIGNTDSVGRINDVLHFLVRHHYISKRTKKGYRVYLKAKKSIF